MPQKPSGRGASHVARRGAGAAAALVRRAPPQRPPTVRVAPSAVRPARRAEKSPRPMWLSAHPLAGQKKRLPHRREALLPLREQMLQTLPETMQSRAVLAKKVALQLQLLLRAFQGQLRTCHANDDGFDQAEVTARLLLSERSQVPLHHLVVGRAMPC
mmetsp:Transcript_85123/g.235842  ORF Transcript_85123/g.235842 Transcript_85123/m.235842 type:complete len:158 (-) Transcript_85123:13-486(-)